MSYANRYPSMDRKALARRAFNAACDRVARDQSLSTSEKRARYFRISNAYEARKSQIDLAAFIGFHGLDRALSTMAKEHSEGRIGDVSILPSPILSQQEKAA